MLNFEVMELSSNKDKDHKKKRTFSLPIKLGIQLLGAESQLLNHPTKLIWGSEKLIIDFSDETILR